MFIAKNKIIRLYRFGNFAEDSVLCRFYVLISRKSISLRN